MTRKLALLLALLIGSPALALADVVPVQKTDGAPVKAGVADEDPAEAAETEEAGDDEGRGKAERILSALDLPSAAQRARGAGVGEDDVKDLVAAAKKHEIRHDDAVHGLEAAARARKEGKEIPGLGAAVRAAVHEGKHGRELADAIHAMDRPGKGADKAGGEHGKAGADHGKEKAEHGKDKAEGGKEAGKGKPAGGGFTAPKDATHGKSSSREPASKKPEGDSKSEGSSRKSRGGKLELDSEKGASAKKTDGKK